MEGAAIISCTCNDEQQDKMYGKGKRVGNLIGKTSKEQSLGQYRCTVCSKVNTLKTTPQVTTKK